MMTLIVEAQSPPLQVDQDGVIRVGDTRVTLATVIHTFNQGHTAEEIVSHYPALKLADVYAIISYYLNNEMTVSRYTRRGDKATRRQGEKMSDYARWQYMCASKKKMPKKYGAISRPCLITISSVSDYWLVTKP